MSVYITHTVGGAGVWEKYPFVLAALGTRDPKCVQIQRIIKGALSRNTDLSPRQLTSDFQYNYLEYSLMFQMLRIFFDAINTKEGLEETI